MTKLSVYADPVDFVDDGSGKVVAEAYMLMVHIWGLAHAEGFPWMQPARVHLNGSFQEYAVTSGDRVGIINTLLHLDSLNREEL
jgi:hypothetical protein